MGKMILYHGSPNKMIHPIYGLCEDKHDYGRGFYLTAKNIAFSIYKIAFWIFLSRILTNKICIASRSYKTDILTVMFASIY